MAEGSGYHKPNIIVGQSSVGRFGQIRPHMLQDILTRWKSTSSYNIIILSILITVAINKFY